MWNKECGIKIILIDYADDTLDSTKKNRFMALADGRNS